jgi:CheY-like chemotaxis protein
MYMQQINEEVQNNTRLAKKIILVVEDDDCIGRLLVEALTEETSYSTLLVTDGQQALKAIGQIKPCLFITDYHLPNMNGIELYDRLHAMPALKNTPAIIMSASLPEEDVKKREMTAMNKPFDLDEFLNTVERLLKQ